MYQPLLISIKTRKFSFNKSLDKCSPNGNNICKNGGTCTVNEDQGVKCQCPLSHNGVHCEKGMNLIMIKRKQYLILFE